MEIYNICLGNGWAIEPTSHFERAQTAKYELFGQFEIFKDEIAWIYDISAPSGETIKACEKIVMFNRTCEFNVYKLDKTGDKWVKNEIFNGTFINALQYIKENYKG
ncbi:hypothetical protein [Campylobacter hyointestinalis]|uniref:hypothetical protein n=1 Tax=Campylobacter hyointestinalis TaxID=198 RepID=UPI0007257FD7|nr:hypothetical protein [Campylobacter hyointestinalis]CUU82192.1 Uncharacterised protein [Campylobacter hyointestinalis subsp. hyointestinalis]